MTPMDLLNHIFDIQKKVDAIVPEGYEMVDSGMFIPEGTEEELWRDNCLEKEGKDFAYSFSTSGKLKGDVPPEMSIALSVLLEENKVK